MKKCGCHIKVVLGLVNCVYAKGAMRRAEPCELAVQEGRIVIVSRWVTVMGYCLPPSVDRFVDRRTE